MNCCQLSLSHISRGLGFHLKLWGLQAPASRGRRALPLPSFLTHSQQPRISALNWTRHITHFFNWFPPRRQLQFYWKLEETEKLYIQKYNWKLNSRCPISRSRPQSFLLSPLAPLWVIPSPKSPVTPLSEHTSFPLFLLSYLTLQVSLPTLKIISLQKIVLAQRGIQMSALR